MAIATGTAIAIALGVGSAVGTGVAAHKKSTADMSAAELEYDAADKAMALQTKMYEQDRADFDPYRQAGAAALGRLGELQNRPPALFDPTQPYGSRTFRGAGGFVDSNGQDRNMGATQGGGMASPGPNWQAGGGQIGMLGAPGSMGMGGSASAQAQQGQSGQGDMVLMESPDGEQREVPRASMHLALAKGARLIR